MGISADTTGTFSKLRMHVDDPVDQDSVVSAVAKLRVDKRAGYDVTLHKDYRKTVEGFGTPLPESVCETTGRRTNLTINLRFDLPKQALIFLPSHLCFCPDALHALARIVEHEMKWHGQDLLNLELDAELQRFEENASVRDIKPPRFSFDMASKRKIGEISLSGKDAAVLIADHEDLIAGGCSGDVCPMFQGVYSHNDRPLCKFSSKEITVLLELHGPEISQESFPGDKEGPGISKRTLADLQFRSLNELTKMLRSKEPFDIETYKKWVETYLQCTKALFGPKALTPYKLKLDIIWRIVDMGYIFHPWYYLCEVGENTNHTAHKEYYTNSTRDGGSDEHNKNSDYLDMRQGFFGVIELGRERCQTVDYWTMMEQYETTVVREIYPADTPTPTYLDIAEKAPPVPKLNIGKTTTGEIMLGMRFTLSGTFPEKMTINKTALTGQKLLIRLIKDMGGMPVSSTTAISNSNAHAYLPASFCVLKDSTQLDNWVTPGNSDKLNDPSNHFCQVTKGDWTFIKSQYIVDCYNADPQQLLDPATYILHVNDPSGTKFVKHKLLDIPRQLDRQMKLKLTDANNMPLARPVLAYTALQNFRRSLVDKKTVTGRTRALSGLANIVRRLDSRGVLPANRPWYKFLKDFTRKETARRVASQLPKQSVSRTNRLAAAIWEKLPPLGKESWRKT
jgi:hypothetical protein